MFLRLGLSGKGFLTLFVGLLSLLLGTQLHQPYLNLIGYYLIASLASALVLGFLEIRGLRIQALAGHPDPEGKRSVWVRLVASRRAGPFGLCAGDGRRWGSELVAGAPDVAGTRLEARFMPGRPWLVRLRSFPLGLLAMSRIVPCLLTTIDAAAESARPRPNEEPGLPFGGLRDHLPSEGIRDVHWSASARLQHLVVRIRDRSTTAGPDRPQLDPPFISKPSEQRVLLHLASCLASGATVAFSWSLGALSNVWGPLLILAQVAGTWLSVRRMGRPGWPLLIGLYVGNLGALGWFIASLRPTTTPSPALGGLLAVIVTLFSFDLRNRTYLRAQQLNTLLMLVVVPLTVPLQDSGWNGLLFTLAALGLLLASWADGRHAIGAGAVTLADLRDLPTAWRPLAILALIAALVHPWLPAIPLPPVPTFGMLGGRAEGEGGWHPGHEGQVDLNARWPLGWSTAVRLRGAPPQRLRSEVRDTYLAGSWLRAAREKIGWPRGVGTPAEITLLDHGFLAMPVPEAMTGVQIFLPGRMFLRGRILASDVPAWSGYTFRVELASATIADRSPPSRAEARSGPPGLAAMARAMIDQVRDPERIMALLTASVSASARYDLDAPVPPPGEDPILFFLARSHRGFCVHFASATALLARACGIPSRLVLGYLPGSLENGAVAYHQADAHAWVEAYVRGEWRSYDPTPPREAMPLRADAETTLRGSGLLLLLSGLGFMAWRRRPRTLPVVREYRRALARLKRRGAPISLATSPREAAALARGSLGETEAEAFSTLVSHYEVERFGKAP